MKMPKLLLIGGLLIVGVSLLAADEESNQLPQDVMAVIQDIQEKIAIFAMRQDATQEAIEFLKRAISNLQGKRFVAASLDDIAQLKNGIISLSNNVKAFESHVESSRKAFEGHISDLEEKIELVKNRVKALFAAGGFAAGAIVIGILALHCIC